MHASAKNVRKEKRKIVDLKNGTDLIDAAEEAGLRYVSDTQPGYTRKANGDGFEYFDTDKKPIRDEQRLLRISRLAIPPAWSDVWICPSPNGHIQATGRDARGRTGTGRYWHLRGRRGTRARRFGTGCRQRSAFRRRTADALGSREPSGFSAPTQLASIGRASTVSYGCGRSQGEG